MDFRLSLKDLESPWFHRSASRGVAHDYLRNAPSGSFLIRPSSHAGMYALSYVKGGVIADSIVYCQYPGFSLKKYPRDDEKYSSLLSLVQHCPFLKSPIVAREGDDERIARLHERKLQVWITDALYSIEQNSSGADSLEWKIFVMDSVETYLLPQVCEQRTVVKLGSKTAVFPIVFTLSMKNMVALGASLSSPGCRRLSRLVLNGCEGIGLESFHPSLTDELFASLCESLASNQSLKELDVSVNAIGDRGAAALAKWLASRHQSLLKLNVSHNFISHQGAVLLATALRYNGTLNDIILSPQYVTGANSGGGGAVSVSRDEILAEICGALSNAYLRKQEIFLPLADSQHYRVHGFLTEEVVTTILASVQPCTRGLFLFYLHVSYPDSLRVAFVNQRGQVEHHSIQRVEQGYTLATAHHRVKSLKRYALWLTWASSLSRSNAAVAPDLPEDLLLQLKQTEELLPLWQPEDPNELLMPQVKSAAPIDSRDPWQGIYPTLFYLMCGLRRHLVTNVWRKG